MKKRLLHLVLTLLAITSLEANQTLEVNSKQVKEMIKTNTLYVIGVDEKDTIKENKVKVKSFQTLKRGLLEYRFSKLNLDKYKKDTMFVVSSKKDSTSLKLVKKLKELGFENAKYLKDGNKTWNEILLNFRGLKLFYMFSR